MEPPPENPRELITQWLRRVREAQGTHYECAKPLDRYNLIFGIPVIALSTIVGTSVFASLDAGSEHQRNTSLRIAVGLISVLAAVLAALQTFLRFSERAEKHRAIGARYGAIRREIEQIIADKACDGDMGKSILDSIRSKMDSLAADAPATPQRLFNEVADRLKAEEC